MALRNIPVVFEAYRLLVTEAPTIKMRKDDKTGEMVPATDYKGVQQFTVSVFAKPLPNAEGYQGKGEELKVTMSVDPGDDITEGMYVSLISPTVSMWQNDNGAGLTFKAEGIVPAASMRSVA